MIRALEEHLSMWMAGHLAQLATESGLYGQVKTVTGSLNLPPSPPLPAGAVALLIRVDGLAPVPENRDLGPAPVTQGTVLRAKARMELRILGDADPLSAATGREVMPPGAHLHRVDLAALTLLAAFRERPGPAPDLPEQPELDAVQGLRPAGAASAAQGARKAHLYWTALEAGEAVVTLKNAKNLRQWDIPLQADVCFRLSPATLEGGRILAINQVQDAQGKPLRHHETALYAPAEAIPLDHFEGLDSATLVELAESALTVLGDLGRLGAARVALVAGTLRTANAGERTRLSQLAAIAELRASSLANEVSYQLDPDMLALPARALLTPTPAETTIMARVINTVEISSQIAVLALATAAALKVDRRETVRLGTLLAKGR